MTAASDARLTVEQIQKRREAAEEAGRKLQLLKQDLRETFASPHGQRALRHIMEQAGYQKASTIGDPNSGDPLPYGTIYNEGRRNLYLSLRKLLTAEILIPVENRGLEEDGEDLLG